MKLIYLHQYFYLPCETGGTRSYDLASAFVSTGIDVTVITTSSNEKYKNNKRCNVVEKEGIKTKVMNLASVKPIDKDEIVKLAKETKCIVTVEEHQIAGGLGGAVAEILAQNYPVPIEFVGVKDLFGQSGTPNELIGHYGMGKESIKEAVRKVLKRKV